MTHTLISISGRFLAAGMLVSISAATAHAATVPFTEDFTNDTAQWFADSAGSTPLTFNAAGGPGDSSFASRVFNFAGSAAMDTPVFFRGQNAFGSSGGAFTGDWIADGVTQFSAFVRHDAASDLTFFTRFASPFNFPALVGLSQTAVPPNQWTEIVFQINPGAPFIAEGPSTFAGVFSNLGNLQIGALAGSQAGIDTDINLGIDRISIVPEPASLTLLALVAGAMGITARQRNHR